MYTCLKHAVCHTFHLAILAHVGTLFRAFGSWMSFLIADPASTLENTRLSALRLVVSNAVSDQRYY